MVLSILTWKLAYGSHLFHSCVYQNDGTVWSQKNRIKVSECSASHLLGTKTQLSKAICFEDEWNACLFFGESALLLYIIIYICIHTSMCVYIYIHYLYYIDILGIYIDKQT